VACIDETIQMFVPGRGPGLLDVGIDSCGVLMGMLLLNTAYFLKRKHKNSFGG
jgi:VanZ family protein